MLEVPLLIQKNNRGFQGQKVGNITKELQHNKDSCVNSSRLNMKKCTDYHDLILIRISKGKLKQNNKILKFIYILINAAREQLWRH